MSTTIQEKNDISITRFFAGEDVGVAFQVTWHSSDKNNIFAFDFVSFVSQEDAEKFAELLEKRLIR